MESGTQTAVEQTAVDIRCPDCGLLLAKRECTGELVVRWKELEVSVVGGAAAIRCRRCGTVCHV